MGSWGKTHVNLISLEVRAKNGESERVDDRNRLGENASVTPGEATMMSKTKSIAALLSIAILAGCSSKSVPKPAPKPTLEFRNLRVVNVTADAKTQATRVRIGFEIFRAGKTVSGLSKRNFQAFEDGVRATSESLTGATAEDIRVPVTLLLDTSLSMYEAGAVAELKQAALTFVERLESSGYAVKIMKFDTEIKVLDSINRISASGEGRWTSLYAAIDRAIRENENAIVVVFSDGADNYSQNHGVASLEKVKQQIGDRVVHAIGFGNLQEEYDRQDVSALEALQQLSVNGSIELATEATEFGRVFSDLSDRLRSVYLFDYFSPNLSGDHTLEIQVSHGGQTARTSPIKFTGKGGREGHQPGETFRDCETCPQMVVVPAGSFMMGSPTSEAGRDDDEGPVHQVTIAEPFAVGRYEVTVGEYERFARATGYKGERGCEVWTGKKLEMKRGRMWREPGFRQIGRDPVVCVSWKDARAYAQWLSRETDKRYRLLSEAEWEYVARAGTRAARYWGAGAAEQCRYANGADVSTEFERKIGCNDGHPRTAPVGEYEANRFGLYDVLGNVWEWVEDCWNESYADAPRDGRVWERGNCSRRVLRSGSWDDRPGLLRSANRARRTSDYRGSYLGFRIARSLP